MREFLVGLERVSPWWPPFDVSGKSKKQLHMPIAEDLSDFEEVVIEALNDKEVRFFSEAEPETMRIRRDSRTVFGTLHWSVLSSLRGVVQNPLKLSPFPLGHARGLLRHLFTFKHTAQAINRL